MSKHSSKKMHSSAFHAPRHVLLAGNASRQPQIHGDYDGENVAARAGQDVAELKANLSYSRLATAEKNSAHRSSSNSPSLDSPPTALRCGEYYEANRRDNRLIFAFLVGVENPTELLGLNHSFSLARPPFHNRRRDFKPTSKVMQLEILRRASLRQVQRMPRPSQWSTEKLVHSLSHRFAPVFTAEEKIFLKKTCRKLYDEAMKRLREDQASELVESPSLTPEIPPSLGGLISKLRLYHTLGDLRSKFLANKRGRKSLCREHKFWVTAAERYNDLSFLPKSMAIPQLAEFEEPMVLPWNFTRVTSHDLAAAFSAIKPKLREIVKEWNKSFNPPVLVELKDGLVEQWDYAALCNRLGSRDDVENHLVYLWEYANENIMLGSCMAKVLEEEYVGEKPLEMNVTTDDCSEASPLAQNEFEHDDDDEAEEAECQDHVDANEGREDVVLHRELAEDMHHDDKPSDTNAQVTMADASTDGEHMYQHQRKTLFHRFVTSQELQLDHLRVYNSIENEILEIELKKLSAKSDTERLLYERFSTEKRALRESLYQHVVSSTIHAKRVAQDLDLTYISSEPMVDNSVEGSSTDNGGDSNKGESVQNSRDAAMNIAAAEFVAMEDVAREKQQRTSREERKTLNNGLHEGEKSVLGEEALFKKVREPAAAQDEETNESKGKQMGKVGDTNFVDYREARLKEVVKTSNSEKRNKDDTASSEDEVVTKKFRVGGNHGI